MKKISIILSCLLVTGCYPIIYFLFKPDYIIRFDVDLNKLDPVTVEMNLENHKRGRGEYRDDKVGPYTIYLSDRAIKKEEFFSSELYRLVKKRNDTAIFVKSDTPLFAGGLKLHIEYNDGIKEDFTVDAWAGPPGIRWHEAEIPVGKLWLHRTRKKGISKLTFNVIKRDESLIPLVRKPYLLITKGDD